MNGPHMCWTQEPEILFLVPHAASVTTVGGLFILDNGYHSKISLA